MSMEQIVAAADGSALGNPGPAGWGWYIDPQRWRCGGWVEGTNNQAELMAVLDLLHATAHRAQYHLHILCDSQYVVNALTQWIEGWKRKNWKKADGKPVLNRDLFEEIDKAMVGRSLSFEWVRGHAGHTLNEIADEIARGAATIFSEGDIPESGPGFDAQSAPAPDPVAESLEKKAQVNSGLLF